ncbi:MAG: DEAD/DEAH box helicase, partial [Myxococcota bacterium]
LNGHLDRHFANAPDGVREAARDAVQRRWLGSFALDVLHRPARGGRGRYRVTSGASSSRTYDLMLRELEPLDIACSCADYRSGGLGLCKHGLAVLRELVGHDERLAQFEKNRGTRPRARWSPFWSPSLPSDWLAGVELRSDAWSGRTPRFLKTREDRLVPRTSALGSAKTRMRLVEAVEAVHGGRGADPSLSTWLSFEREQLHRRAVLSASKRGARRALRTFAATLRPYQRDAVDRFLEAGRLLLADDMGLGKTVQAAAIAHVLLATGAAERVLVIAPASLKMQWRAEWNRFVPDSLEVPATVVFGSAQQREARYADTERGVLIANYEQIHRDLEAIEAFAPDLVVLDEAQRIKNWPTRTARSVKRIDSPYRLVLTGTPIENRLDELMSILDWLAPYAVAPKWRLPAEHLVASGDGIVGMRNLDALRARLAPICLRRSRDEVLDELPEREDRTHHVGVTDRQQALHDDLIPDIAKLLQVSKRRPLKQREFLRLMMLFSKQRMLANGIGLTEFETIYPEIRTRSATPVVLESLHAPKLEYLRDLVLRIAVDEGKRVVVFSQWRRFLQLAHWSCSEALAEAGVSALFFSGQETQRARAKNVERFHEDPNARVLWCTDAGGVGLNLQRAAHICVHTELPWNPAVFEQRVARIHRMGQPEHVTVHTLVAPTTIEARLSASIATKRKLFAGVFDGDSDEVHFDESGSAMAALRDAYEEAMALDLESAAGDREKEEEGPDEDAPISEDGDRASEVNGKLSTGSGAVYGADGATHARGVQAGPSADHPLHAMPDSAVDIQQALASLSIRPQPDGGLHIDAPPAAASALVTLFRGLADALDRKHSTSPFTNAGP